MDVGGETIFPKGSVFEGHVETVKARRPLRSGAMRLFFDQAKLPNGTIRAVPVELMATDAKSAKVDDEGTLKPRLSKKRLAIQLGGALLAAKIADDVAEEASTSVTPGKARFYGMASAGVVLLLQKGREVHLKPGDTVEVEFGREGAPLSLNPAPEIK